MKICQIMGGSGGGGLERHFVDLCSGLAKKHDIVAVAHPMYASWFPDEVSFEPLDMTKGRKNPLLLFHLWKIIQRNKPDIVHAQANKAAAMVSRLSPFIKSKKVATIHNLKSRTKMYDAFDRVIAVSYRVASQLDPQKTDVVVNGIAPPTLSEGIGKNYLKKEVPDLSGRCPVLITVGRLVPAKGMDLLLSAMQGVDAELIIVGDGPDKERLQKQASELKLTGRVFFLGHRDDVPDLLASADMAVIASRNEGFPYVLVETLHVRQRVLSTCVPGAEDVLPERFLVPVGDVDGLRNSLNDCLRDLNGMSSLFQSVWAYAERELTVEGMVCNVEKIYNWLVDNRELSLRVK
jgi:glycosyltransferase involved in cell wall biosynthesis